MELSRDRSLLRSSFVDLLEQPGAWGAIVAAALLESALALGSPWVASRALDAALPDGALDWLGLLAVCLVALAAHAAAANYLHQRLTALISHRLEASSLVRLLRGQLATPYERLCKADFGGTSETLGAASSLVLTLTRWIVEGVTHLSGAALTLGLLAYYESGLALATLVLSLTIALACALLTRREARLAQVVLEKASQRQQWLHVLLGAIATVRAFGAERRLGRAWAELAREQSVAGLERDRTRLLRDVTAQAGRHVGTWLATLWLIQRTLDRSLSLGGLITSTLLVANFLRTFVELTHSNLELSALFGHRARIDALLEAGTGPEPNPRATVQAPDTGIVLDQVWFRYAPSSPWVLSGLERRFPAREHSVLRAASGAGKTTILRLIAGLVRPAHGTVSVLGCDPSVTPGLVAYLPQQSSLLEGSIATNLVTLGRASLEHALRVAELTGLSDLLAELPMGVHTVLSPAGGNLSAGQRQLVLLTAAFAQSAPVVLLDEATSQLDVVARGRIQWAELTRGRTVISVQHV